jgi:flagellar assembly protein FliH
MSTRLDLSDASVSPFQFPSLEDVAEPKSVSVAGEAVPGVMAGPGEDVVVNGTVPHADTIALELAQLRAEAIERGLTEGREQGYAAGYAEGAAIGEVRLTEAVERLAAIVRHLGEPLAVLEQPVEEAIVALALEIARCVIGNEVRRSHEFLVRLVREAIAAIPLEMGSPRVLLNPADLELIRKLVPEAEAGHASLVADDTVEPGGCLVIADGESRGNKDRRWNPRVSEGVSQVNLTLSSRWRAVMLTLFDGEES